MKKPEQKSSVGPERRRGFRIFALCIPLLLLLVVEGGLRLSGFGYPTKYFLKSTIAGESVWIENQNFTKRFFPPGLARSPQPTVIRAARAKDTIRIFIFGESAAMGDPEPAYGFGRILQALLKSRYPGKEFEVVNAAVTAINSHVVREIAKGCASMEGDIWIIYMGNNEVVGPFGAGTVFGPQTSGLGFIRANLALKSTRLGQLVEEIKHRLRLGPQAPVSWEGMEMFLKQQVAQSDPRMAKVYAHFSENLSSIIEAGRESGAQILLCTVPNNLKDCPPFASQQQTEASAEAQFALGRALLAEGQIGEAATNFLRARDLDTLRFRADSEINSIIRTAATSNCKLVDLESVVAKGSKDGIPGEEFFFEHVHLNFDGNYLVARALAAEVERGAWRVKGGERDWLTRDECARRLAFTEWDEFQVLDEMVKRMELPPFSNQLGHAERLARWKERRAQLEAKLNPESHDSWVQTYTHALKLAPNDWVLRENFARLLQKLGDPPQAEKEWRRVTELMPHYASAWYGLGNVLDGQGKSGEALFCFQQALKLNPHAVEARNGLGLALAALGKTPEAVAEYTQALRTKPDFTEARVNLGLTLAQQGQHEAAIREYRTALRANSNSVAAHLNLGKALMLRGETNSAIAHYREAVRLNPQNPIAHFNLGNALGTESTEDAIKHLKQAVRLKPDFSEAHYNLGLALSTQQRYLEALEHLETAAQLSPNLAEVHFNLGVAYAKQRRFVEAVAAFENAVRLDPQNSAARKYLEQARKLQGK